MERVRPTFGLEASGLAVRLLGRDHQLLPRFGMYSTVAQTHTTTTTAISTPTSAPAVTRAWPN
jgi:hypothetical protein